MDMLIPTILWFFIFLVTFGMIVMICVHAYDWWQDRKYRKIREKQYKKQRRIQRRIQRRNKAIRAWRKKC
jgi:hypothetical protein